MVLAHAALIFPLPPAGLACASAARANNKTPTEIARELLKANLYRRDRDAVVADELVAAASFKSAGAAAICPGGYDAMIRLAAGPEPAITWSHAMTAMTNGADRRYAGQLAVRLPANVSKLLITPVGRGRGR